MQVHYFMYLLYFCRFMCDQQTIVINSQSEKKEKCDLPKLIRRNGLIMRHVIWWVPIAWLHFQIWNWFIIAINAHDIVGFCHLSLRFVLDNKFIYLLQLCYYFFILLEVILENYTHFNIKWRINFYFNSIYRELFYISTSGELSVMTFGELCFYSTSRITFNWIIFQYVSNK